LIAELIQSRDASASEALAIFRDHMNVFRSRLAANRSSHGGRVGLVILAGALGALLIMAANSRWMQDLRPTVAIVATVIFAAVALRAWVHVYYRRCAEVYRDSFKADRRFRIEEHAVIATNSSGVVSSIPWTAISDIVIGRDSLTIYLSPAEAFSLPKGACENQDVDAFCVELQRRWRDQGGRLKGPSA
jgi:hypothetical protein